MVQPGRVFKIDCLLATPSNQIFRRSRILHHILLWGNFRRYYTKFNADALKRAGMGNLAESVWEGSLAGVRDVGS